MINELLRRAWEEMRVLRIVYQSWNESGIVRERDIDVYAFDEKYVDAYCRLRGEGRTFRVDRIKSAVLLDLEFTRDPEVEHWVKVSGFSKQAHECQRPCCRNPAPRLSQSGAWAWIRRLFRITG